MNAFSNLPEPAQADPAQTPPVERPPLAFWLWERDLDLRTAGRLFEVSHQTVRSWTLPFGHPERCEPRPAQAAKVEVITRGAVPRDSFKRPERRP